MSNQAGFWNWMAERYSRQAVADEASYREKLSRTREYFGPDCRVLEFGCGTGSTAIAHAPHVGHIHATDISVNMLSIAEAKASAEGLSNISFEEGSLQQLDSEAASWDVILGLSVLHLLPDRAGDISRVHQLLKPGGVFVSSTPCIGDMSSPFRFIAPLFRLLPFLPSVWVFSLQELQSGLEEAGLHIEECWQPGPDKAVFMVARKQ